VFPRLELDSASLLTGDFARQATACRVNVVKGLLMLPSHDGREHLDWRKAKRSMNNGNCAEVATLIGIVAVRDSKDPQGPVLQYPVMSWRSFLTAARNGGFDALR
jgi:hypothetical protein